MHFEDSNPTRHSLAFVLSASGPSSRVNNKCHIAVGASGKTNNKYHIASGLSSKINNMCHIASRALGKNKTTSAM